MRRAILGVVTGLAVWVVVASAAGAVLRASWPEYVIADRALTFTLGMKVARLSIGALATVALGFATSLVSRSSAAVLAASALLLVVFIPMHIMLWDKFPVWYHLTFLLSLVPLSYAGGRLTPPRRDGTAATARAAHP